MNYENHRPAWTKVPNVVGWSSFFTKHETFETEYLPTHQISDVHLLRYIHSSQVQPLFPKDSWFVNTSKYNLQACETSTWLDTCRVFIVCFPDVL